MRWLPPALVLSLLAGCAAPAPNLHRLQLGGWHELRARDFTLIGALDDAELRRHAEDLEILVAVANRLTNVSDAPSRVPVRVVLAPDDVYRVLVRAPGIAGLATSRLDGHFLIVSLFGVASSSRQVLLHEYTHFLEHKNRASATPPWYEEGFAELLGTVHRREDVVLVGSPPGFRTETLRGIAKIDVAEVMAPQRMTEVRDVFRFYAVSWALVHYLNAGAETRSRLPRYFQLLAQGVAWNDAVPRAFGVSVERLSAAVDAHVRNILRGVPSEIAAYDLDDLAIDRSWEIGALSAAEVASELGELPVLTDRAERGDAYACAFFTRAVEADPRHARSRASRALCDAGKGDFESASQEIATALRDGPDDARVAVRAGEIELLRAGADAAAAPDARHAARTSFARATTLAPGDPVAWAQLGASYVEGEGDPQPGVDALERACELGAWDADANLDLARLLLRVGRRDDARARLQDVIRLDDGDAAKQAEQLLAGTGAAN